MAASKPVPPVHDVFVRSLSELVGISLLAVVADMNDNLGKVAVALMGGWLLIFLITNATSIQGWAGKLNG